MALLPFALLVVLAAGVVDTVSADCDDIANIKREKGHCIMFGACFDSPYVTDGKYNCFDNGPARNASEQGEEFYQLLKDTCPQYIERGEVCCDLSQLYALATQIKLPQQLFSRCPACLRNFIDHFCSTTCNPDQALFMTPIDCQDGTRDNGTSNLAIAKIAIYLSDSYTKNLYRSCSNVQYPQASSRVVDIMCGGTDECNATLWLTYLGDPVQNHNSPFYMTYVYGNSSLPTGVVPDKRDFLPCNTSSNKYRCSCADCNTADLCPAPPQPPHNNFNRSTVMYSIIGVGLFLSFVVFFATMVIGIWLVFLKDNGGYTPILPGALGEDSRYGSLVNDSTTSSVINDKVDQSAMNPPRSTLCLPCYISGARLENFIKIAFYRWGCFVAKFWLPVILVGVGLCVIVVLLSVVLHVTSVLPFLITTDPVELWSAPDSRARQEKNYFDKNFNPFYRTEMIIITVPNGNLTEFQPMGVVGSEWTFGPVMTSEVLHEVYRIQNHLQNMVVNYMTDNGTESSVTLSDICYKPLYPGSNNSDDCVIMSIINYFQNNINKLDYTESFGLVNNSYHIYYCTRDPTAPEAFYFTEPDVDIPCLGAYGGPVDPNVILGGFNKLPNGMPNYQNATALIVSFTVNNHADSESNKLAEIWEKAFLDYISIYTSDNISISYTAERSVQDELTRETMTDIYTVAISYLLMFAYITIFLGHIRKPLTVAIDMKITIGLTGVLMVLLAVLTSICFLNLARVNITLIIIEVIPFLVLAVGVDNLFIIVHSFERESCKLISHHGGDMSIVPREEIIGRTIAEVAPSLLLTSLSETAAFLLGGISTIPAVGTFSFYAGIAVFLNFLLQISVFLAALSLDIRRQLDNRFDVFCFIKLKGLFDPRKGLDVMHWIMTWFANVILHPMVRPFILLAFCITSTFSLALMFKLQIGLDQTIALPKDSYLNNYFSDLYKYLHIGPPVYFVVEEGFDYSDPEMQAKFCSASGCSNQSIGTEIFAYSRNSELTTIAEPAMLWLDTYFEWIVPRSQCCGIDSNQQRCLYPQYDNDTCRACITEANLTENGWPKSDAFNKYISWFLEDNPGIRCPSGGHAAFAGGVKLYPNNSVITSYVMTYHTIMTNSSSFVSGIKWARELAQKLSDFTKVKIFPYSVFYVYYEQYLTTIHDMALNIGVSIGAVFVVTFLLMGLNLWAALLIMMVVCMIIVHMIGCMAISGISANAVSLVNLVMTVGISVEFCSHIVRWFCSCSEDSRLKRAHSALANMGASVVSGITITKLLGVFVLFFAKSQIFEIYYFRMYMFMLLWGALHGLVFLPVMLSYIGPSYVTIKVRLPYKNFALPSSHTRSEDLDTSTTSMPLSIEEGKEKPQQGEIIYPSLPNVGDYESPGAGYGRQQEQDIFSGHSSEQSKLLRT